MMICSRCLRQFLMCVAWLTLFSTGVAGQDLADTQNPLQGTPHRILNEDLTRRDIPLIGRWVQSLQEQPFSPEQLLGRIAELQRDQPQLTADEIARKLIQDNPGLQNPSAIDQLQRWQRQLGEMSGILPKSVDIPRLPAQPPMGMPSFPGGNPFSPPNGPNRFPGLPPTPAPGDPQIPGSSFDPRVDYPGMPEEIFGPSPDDLRRQRQFQALRQFWERNFGSLSETPAFRQLLIELFTGNDPINHMAGDGLSLLLGDPDAEPNAATNWVENQLKSTGLDFSQLDLPDLDLPNWNAEIPPAPSLNGTRSWTDSADVLAQLGWVILILGCGLACFLIWRQVSAHRVSARSGSALHCLKNWPVDPRMISNRHEFVCAFEYLSLTLLGSVARSWHHRRIAEAIERQLPDQVPNAATIEDLVRVYVLARYAPEREPLDSHQLSAARSTLCRIAGIEGL